MPAAHERIAAVAATESRNPIERTRRGSIRSRPVTVSPRMRSLPAALPAVPIMTATAAIDAARSTDGSKRVSRPKSPTTVRVSRQRGQMRNRRSTGPAMSRTKATFCPDTARRWVRPAPRKSSAIGIGWWRSSPMTSPVNSDRSAASRGAAPWTSVRRMALASSVTGGPGRHPSTTWTRSLPARWRAAVQSSRSRGETSPRTVTCSPASRGPSASAATPTAITSRRRPAKRAVARIPP